MSTTGPDPAVKRCLDYVFKQASQVAKRSQGTAANSMMFLSVACVLLQAGMRGEGTRYVLAQGFIEGFNETLAQSGIRYRLTTVQQ